MSAINSIRNEIKKRTIELQTLNPFLIKVKSGTITNLEIAAYLSNLMYILSDTPNNLRNAMSRAIDIGNPDLAAYLETKIAEETGHDLWAKEDLKNLNSIQTQLTTETHKLAQFIRSLAESDPRQYVVYMTFVEYFTVQSAPEFLASLENHRGISRKQMSVVANHEEKDKGHSEEGFDWLEQFLHKASLEKEMLQTIRTSYQLVSGCIASCLN